MALEFTGDIQGVALFDDELSDADVAELLECCIWTEISGDVRASVPIEVSRGLMDDNPSTRMAPVGTATFALDNSEDNEGATRSWYSPGHTNVRSGFARGIPVRISLAEDTLGGQIMFLGTLQEIKPTSGIYRDRITNCIAYDWMHEAAKFNLDGIQTQEDVTADELLALIIGRMTNKPHEIALQTGTDTYPVALDSVNDENSFAQTEFSHIALSELGLVYITGDGKFVFENRGYRGSLTTVAYTFDNEMVSAEPDASVDQIINRVRITVYPRKVDASPTTVLFETSTRVAIDHGVQTNTFFQFRDPNQLSARFGGLNPVTPAPTTHYTLNTQEDGLGVDVTSNPLITIIWEFSGSGIYMNVDNQYGQRVYMDLQVLGQGIYNYEPVTVIEKNDDSIRSVGVNEVQIDMKYQNLVPVGQSAALQILNTFQLDTTRLLSVQFPARKDLKYLQAAIFAEISTRLTVMEDQSGISSDFFINGIKITWNQDHDIHVFFSLTPADTQSYWVMDSSVLDSSTRLGF